jgi:DNA-binding NarL/FixJ family response regulator
MSAPLRVAVVSRYDLVRAGLTHLIGLDPARATVVATQVDGADLPDHDVAIHDLAGHHDHTDGLRRLLDSTSKPVVVISPTVDPGVKASLRGLGVAGLVSMSVTDEGLLRCLETAATRRRATTAELRGRTLETTHRAVGLTEREFLILEQIATGKSNEQIAAEQYVSINTVKSNIRTAYKRIGVTSRSQAVIWAITHGLAGAGEPDLPSTG